MMNLKQETVNTTVILQLFGLIQPRIESSFIVLVENAVLNTVILLRGWLLMLKSA